MVNLNMIYCNLRQVYNLKLLAGERGLENQISWIYYTEDHRTVKYIRGNELIITTGMVTASAPEELIPWLSILIDKLISLKAAGLIINVGNYIPAVPDSIIEYCENRDFPLFTMPWEVRLVDILRDVCNYLFENEQRERNIVAALSVAIFSPENISLYENNLRHNGFDSSENYAAICIDISQMSNPRQQMPRLINMSLYQTMIKYSLMFKNDEMVLVLYRPAYELIQEVCMNIQHTFKSAQLSLHMGVGSILPDIRQLHVSHQRAHACLELALRQNMPLVMYEELGFRKLFIHMDRKSLIQFSDQTLSKLRNYDNEHQTDYMGLLRLLLSENMNIQSTARKSYCHRNTIIYRLQRIRELVGSELHTEEERLKFQIAFYIKDMYGKKDALTNRQVWE